MKTGLLTGVLLCALGTGTADAATLNPAGVPRTASAAAGFAPSGFRVEKEQRADLSADGIPDLGIVLIERGAKRERRRGLVIAQGVRGGGYERVGVSARLLACTACGGAFWGLLPAPITLSVQRGALLVDQTAGSRELIQTVHRLRIERNRRVRLIGLDSSRSDRNTGNGTRVSTNYLTGEVAIEFLVKSAVVKTGTATVSKVPHYLEALRVRDPLASL